MEKDSITKKIQYWKRKRNALILAHNYQLPQVQDLADYVADSLGLAQRAAASKEKIIVFCGVHFMAESASIYSSDKTILIPDLEAGCSLAASIDLAELRKWKKKYPKAIVVSYVNTTAEIKAESDYCVTSANAVKIVNSIDKNKQILFVPDMFLGDYVAKMTGRDLIIYPGECHVHARVRVEDIADKLGKHPKADFLIHPECGCVSTCMHYVASGDISGQKTHIYSTGGMLSHAKTSKSKEFVVATETGMLHPLKKTAPDKKFFALREDMVCEFMKMITPQKLLHSLKFLQYEVKVPKEIAERARIPIDRMLKLTSK